MKNCYYCGKELPDTTDKCPECYCPLLDGRDAAGKFIQVKLLTAELEAETAIEHIARSRYIFFGVAALVLVNTVVIAVQHQYGVMTLGMTIAGSVLTVGFAAIGFFLQKNPMVFSLIGLASSFIFFPSLLWMAMMVAIGLCTYYSYGYISAKKRLKVIQTALDLLKE